MPTCQGVCGPNGNPLHGLRIAGWRSIVPKLSYWWHLVAKLVKTSICSIWSICLTDYVVTTLQMEAASSFFKSRQPSSGQDLTPDRCHFKVHQVVTDAQHAVRPSAFVFLVASTNEKAGRHGTMETCWRRTVQICAAAFHVDYDALICNYCNSMIIIDINIYIYKL